MFHLPEICTVRRQFAASAKVMLLPAYQIYRHAAARVKMSRVTLAVGIDGYKHTFVFRFSLEDTLLIGQYDRTETAVIKRLGIFLRLRESADKVASSFHAGFSKQALSAGSPSLFCAFAPHSLP